MRDTKTLSSVHKDIMRVSVPASQPALLLVHRLCHRFILQTKKAEILLGLRGSSFFVSTTFQEDPGGRVTIVLGS
jgi:hypothetical protein